MNEKSTSKQSAKIRNRTLALAYLTISEPTVLHIQTFLNYANTAAIASFLLMPAPSSVSNHLLK